MIKKNSLIKLLLIFIFTVWIFFQSNSTWEVFALWDSASVSYSWGSNSYENVIKYEFILDLKWSILEEWIKRLKSRVSILSNENWYKILKVKNVTSAEEKLVLRLYWKTNNYVDFVNFDTKEYSEKFNDIELIEYHWKIKAKVVIYVSQELNWNVYSILWNWIKWAKYLYFWLKKWKPYKKARAIKIY